MNCSDILVRKKVVIEKQIRKFEKLKIQEVCIGIEVDIRKKKS